MIRMILYCLIGISSLTLVPLFLKITSWVIKGIMSKEEHKGVNFYKNKAKIEKRRAEMWPKFRKDSGWPIPTVHGLKT